MLRGNLDGAQQHWTEIRALPPIGLALELGTITEAELYLWRGAPGIAFDHARALLVRIAEANHGVLVGPLLTFAGPVLVLALRACADLAEQASAERDAEALTTATRYAKQLSELHARMTPDPLTSGPLRPTAAADGATRQAEGSRLRGQSDVALWEQAATAWDALSRPHRAAYARWRQAEALLSTPQGRADAAAVLRTAAPQALQHVPLAAAIGELARRARVDLSPPGPKARPEERPPRAFDLTERELVVLELLAQGKTNSEIGATLFISRKTASVHVSNILRKLGVPTRVQAAAVAERVGLLHAD